MGANAKRNLRPKAMICLDDFQGNLGSFQEFQNCEKCSPDCVHEFVQ